MLFSILKKIKFKGKIDFIDYKGNKHSFGQAEPYSKVRFTNKSIERKLVRNPGLYLGEGYMNKEIVIEAGTIEDFINVITFSYDDYINHNSAFRMYKKILSFCKPFQQINRLVQSKNNVAHHYDLNEDLYRLMLDKDMQYSCAYFHNENISLEQAQTDKKKHIIEKLQIKDHMEVLDIGCGWGGMAFEIARQSQCEITGISLSENQINYCNKKAKELKLDNQVHFELCDYRKVKGKFQKIVSVGAFEHFGKKFYKTFFQKVHDVLTDDGISLLHTIGSVNPPGPVQPFIQKRIFPGGITPSLSDLVKPIEKTGLIIADCETLIHHYDKTLRAWLKRFLKNKEKAKSLHNREFVRMWECYLSMCSAAFNFKDLVVYQLQLVKNFTALPSNRRNYIYQ